MKKIYTAIFLTSLVLVISCGSLGGGSGISMQNNDFKKSFEPKTSWAFVDKTLKRPVLTIFLANFDFNPKSRGDLFRPNFHNQPENVLVKFDVITAENADPQAGFQPGEYNQEMDSSRQRFYSLNTVVNKNNSTETLNMKNYKDAKITISSITDEEVSGTFDIQYVGLDENKKEDPNAFAKGSFRAKFWKEN